MSNELVDFNPESLYGAEEPAEETFEQSAELSEFEEMIMEGTRQDARSFDANKPRYGVALLNPIALFGHGPAFYIGDFNIKHADRKKGNRVNTRFFPRLELMPFTSKTYPIPFEGKAALLTEDQYEEEMDAELESFNVATIESTLRSSRRNGAISAEKWSLQMFDRFKKEGFTLLHDLTGFDSYDEATRLFKAVITAEKVQSRFPAVRRERLGFALEPPFMPEIIRYLETAARDTFEKEARSQEEFTAMERIRIALLLGARTAQTYCEKTLSDTESAISRKEKKGYDLPDFIHRDAKPPKDLVAMIHLNRYPKDMEALRIAETTGAAMASAAAGFNQPQAVQPATDTVPRSEVRRLLDEQDRKWAEKFDSSLNSLREEFKAATEKDAQKIPADNSADKSIGTLPVKGGKTAENKK
jgi:choline dehydrogenase-like flavoprotein